MSCTDVFLGNGFALCQSLGKIKTNFFLEGEPFPGAIFSHTKIKDFRSVRSFYKSDFKLQPFEKKLNYSELLWLHYALKITNFIVPEGQRCEKSFLALIVNLDLIYKEKNIDFDLIKYVCLTGLIECFGIFNDLDFKDYTDLFGIIKNSFLSGKKIQLNCYNEKKLKENVFKIESLVLKFIKESF